MRNWVARSPTRSSAREVSDFLSPAMAARDVMEPFRFTGRVIYSLSEIGSLWDFTN